MRNENLYKQVGAYLRERRLKLGLTQKDVSDKLGYSSIMFISRVEAGDCGPARSTLGEYTRLVKANPKKIVKMYMDNEQLKILKDINA